MMLFQNHPTKLSNSGILDKFSDYQPVAGKLMVPISLSLDGFAAKC